MVIYKQGKKKEKIIPVITIEETKTEFICNGIVFLKKKIITNKFVIGVTRERKSTQLFLVTNFKNFYFSKIKKERAEILIEIYKTENKMKEVKKTIKSQFSKENILFYTLGKKIKGLEERREKLKTTPLIILRIERW